MTQPIFFGHGNRLPIGYRHQPTPSDHFPEPPALAQGAKEKLLPEQQAETEAKPQEKAKVQIDLPEPTSEPVKTEASMEEEPMDVAQDLDGFEEGDADEKMLRELEELEREAQEAAEEIESHEQGEEIQEDSSEAEPPSETESSESPTSEKPKKKTGRPRKH